METMSTLFSPLTINGVTFSNRAWVSPMCQYSCDDGVVGDWHLVHLGGFATGGAGLVMAEATAVVPEGRISIGCPGLWNEEQVAAWRRVTSLVHSQGTVIGVQLAHAGRKASAMRAWDDHLVAAPSEGGWTAVAPSAVAFPGYETPEAMEVGAIDELVEAFVDAARRALDAGFDVLEIHAAHGYLLHEFLSPLSNLRTDAYGGSFENRTRLLLDVTRAVRGAIGPTTPLFVRISATDWTDGGWTLDDSIALAPLLRDAGCDLIDVSSGGNVAGAPIPVGPGYQVPLSAAIRRATGVATNAVGMITDGPQAETILQAGDADAVMVARAFLRNPRWALSAAEALGDVITWPRQIERARTVVPKS